ncbi:MAG TPA: efflux RND transporter periplasmic adaptor subunit [Polyangiales bacterium]|nr:efflux RND transporter periplasmic adaptor subunit [Polyangiales bacterium]
MAAGRRIILGVLVVGAGIGVYLSQRKPEELVLTGMVTTDDVVVSSQLSGQLSKLLVKEGDHVTRDQLLAVMSDAELTAERAFFVSTEQGSANGMLESEATLRYQERLAAQQIREAEASLAAALAQFKEAESNQQQAQRARARADTLMKGGGLSEQEGERAQNDLAVAAAREESNAKQVEAQRAALDLARSAAEQVQARRSALGVAERQHAAAQAQTKKAEARLAYTELHAPIAGIVDVRAARAGEVVTAGQPIVTLVDPDDYWVRADVEETYIDRVKLGDALNVRLPSGEVRQGRVFFRGVDASFATQRDVSRTKRDLKTFEIRLRLDNTDRKLALGMTAYVLLPVAEKHS